jgi:ubiquinone/menaquinone biosynthesis C-methylase UbiE
VHPTRKTYLPAAGKDWLLPLYDPFTKVLGVEASHRKLINQAGISPGHRVLEIGCGTGNLAILVKRLNPASQVVAIDPDPKALARARRKSERRGATIQFDEGFAEELPYPDASFDRVFSAFMLHHVKPDAKALSLQEAFRVLKPGGSLHLADFDEAPAVSMGSWRAFSIRATARAPPTPSSVSCSMPDSWTRGRLLTRLLFWDESCTTKAFGLRPSLQCQNLIESPKRLEVLAA